MHMWIVEKAFLEISQNWQENTCASDSFLIKLQASGPYFPVFSLNTEIYSVDLRIQTEYRKIRTRGLQFY